MKKGRTPLPHGGAVAILVAVLFVPLVAAPAGRATRAPIIDIWYGSKQVFGEPGIAQRWVNVLGNVSSTDGVTSLCYSLNGGPELALAIGPDERRLIAAGDFNVEIDVGELKRGKNNLRIKAEDGKGRTATRDVTVEYKDGRWPLPLRIDWSKVKRIQDAVQVVDGKWILEEDGIRTDPAAFGYDRVLAIGDASWKDYDVTLSFKVHAVDTSVFGTRISVAPAFGINQYWEGHTDKPVKCEQPHCGWVPFGSSHWYEYVKGKPGTFKILTPNRRMQPGPPLNLEPGTTYWMRARAERIRAGSMFSLKYWAGRRSDEPEPWLRRVYDPAPALTSGSFLLVAHHVDITFGNIEVAPVETVQTEPEGRNREDRSR